MAGLIFKTKFINPKTVSKAKFSGYVTYVDRPEAIRREEFKKYDVFRTYQDYMGNPEKTTGLFTKDKSVVSPQGKEKLKELFDLAQKNGGLLNQSVLSFETEWLKKTGLMTKDGNVMEEKLKEYTRKSVSAMVKEEGMEGWIWSAAVHYNTQHVHIHIALAEAEPSWNENVGRCRRNKRTGELYQRGKLKGKSIEKMKSTFINLALESKEKNELINDIIRDRIVLGKQLKPFSEISDRELRRSFAALLESLPDDMRLWKYNMNAMESYRPMIDTLSEQFINTYFKAEYEELQALVKELGTDYHESYGNSKKGTDFVSWKQRDLYSRLGNAILKECRIVRQKQRQYVLENRRESGKEYYHYRLSRRLFYDLKNVFRKDIQTMKNQAAYERFLAEERSLYQD